jgi:hypothetical protein
MKFLRVLKVLVLAGFGTVAALALPILLSAIAPLTPTLSKVAAVVNPLLIATTFAQTAPTTIAEMSTEVSTFATSVMPAWTMYVVFVLIAAIVVWLISRFIRSMKH